MRTKIIQVEPSNAQPGQLSEAVHIINNGGLVSFPTETVYGIACKVENSSLVRLNQIKGRPPEKHYALHIACKEEADKYVPQMSLRISKLVQGGWPGPLTIVFSLSSSDMKQISEEMSSEVVEHLYRDKSIGIRCPAGKIAFLVLNGSRAATVAPSANISGARPATTAQQVLEQLDGKIDLLIDGGPCRYKKSSTVVKIEDGNLAVLRQGVYSSKEVEVLSEVRILLLCTGNTCRSPMAEGFFKQYAARNLGCRVDQLSEKGYKILSAGTVGVAGLPASPEAIAACRAKGIDIRGHRSRALSKELIEGSDLIFAMSHGHCEAAGRLSKEGASKCEVLDEGSDIADPIGCTLKEYKRCAKRIEDAVKKRIEKVQL